MRIAVDGRVLNDAAGKAVYTRSVLEALAKIPGHAYVVYGYQPAGTEKWPDNWLFRPIHSRRERLQIFRRLKEDVLFSPSSYLTSIVSNKPTLTTIHDLVIYKVAVKLPFKTVIAEKFLLKQAVRQSAALTVQTESVKDDLVQLFPFAAAKTRVIRPGVAASVNRAALPTEPEQRRLLHELKIAGRYLLFVGTLEPRKNIVRLVEAYTQLPAAVRQEYQLVLAGKAGWADEPLKALLSNLPPGVILTGRVSNPALATLYRHAEVIAYPSLYEGVGYPVLEGFYWSRPVLTANVSSTKEIGEAAAELVDPRSVPSITAGLQRLLTDEQQRTKLITAGERRLQEFSWDKMAHSYLEIFQKIS